jgi:hypothetical protein
MKMNAWIPFLVLLLALGTPGLSRADDEHPEHPEHPEEAEHKEHPEHPEGHAEVTIEQLGDAIEAWVAWDSELHGGYLLVRDSEAKETLELELDKVHRERLSALGDGVYFACADFKASNGHVYDLDVFMQDGKGSPFHGLFPTEVTVHKKDGKARYTWHEADGVWTKKAP